MLYLMNRHQLFKYQEHNRLNPTQPIPFDSLSEYF